MSTPTLYTTQCPVCRIIFEGTSEWEVTYQHDQHVKGCALPIRHKVLKVLLLPLAMVALPVIIIGVFICFMLHPVAYPFALALNLAFDDEWLSFKDYKKVIGIPAATVWRRKAKKQ